MFLRIIRVFRINKILFGAKSFCIAAAPPKNLDFFMLSLIVVAIITISGFFSSFRRFPVPTDQYGQQI